MAVEKDICSPSVFESRLSSGLDRLSIPFTASMLSQFYLYYRELVKWNRKINLTAISDFKGVITGHFLDSAAYVRALPDSNDLRMLDIGSGAGFPGIPLKILIPSLVLEVADSRNKKLEFMKHLGRILRLEGVEYCWYRFQKENAGRRYDVVVSRACLPPIDFFELAGSLLLPGGRAVLSEGPAASRRFMNGPFPGNLKFRSVSVEIPDSNLVRTLLTAEKKKL